MAGGMSFAEAYEAYAQDIRTSALSQKVPGLDYDDVVSEMSICLWVATETYKAGSRTSFGSYWWSLWLNRRSDIAGAYHAGKRVHPILTDEPLVEGSYVAPEAPEPPTGACAQDRVVWELLAAGDTATEVIADVELTRRRYYGIVGGWRNDEVRKSLRGA